MEYPINLIVSAHLDKHNDIAMLGISMINKVPTLIIMKLDVKTGNLLSAIVLSPQYLKEPPTKVIGMYSDILQRYQGPSYFYVALIEMITPSENPYQLTIIKIDD